MTRTERVVGGRVLVGLRLARALAAQHQGQGVHYDDLESDACLALLQAACRYKPGRGEFATYAHIWIVRAIRRRIADEPLSQLGGLTIRDKRDALKVRNAVAALRARGVHRPSIDHIAAEAQATVETTRWALALPSIRVAQATVESVADDYPPRPGGEPELAPLFGVRPFDPQSPCPHFDEIEPGEPFCCMVCHRSGMDGHPKLYRDPTTTPKPDKKPSSPPAAAEPGGPRAETRRQRRRRTFAEVRGNFVPATGHPSDEHASQPGDR